MASISPFTFFLSAGIALIALELIIFQFAAFWLFFIGTASLIAALALFIVGESSWVLATLVFVVSLALLVALLYKPLKRWQQQPGKLKGNTAIGQKVTVIEDISAEQTGKVHWSGTDWLAELDTSAEVLIPKGASAEIVSLEGIRLTVKPV